MAIKTSYVAMGYKEYSFFLEYKKYPTQSDFFFSSLAREGLKTTHPATLHRAAKM
jgi:hypothetical protein